MSYPHAGKNDGLIPAVLQCSGKVKMVYAAPGALFLKIFF